MLSIRLADYVFSYLSRYNKRSIEEKAAQNRTGWIYHTKVKKQSITHNHKHYMKSHKYTRFTMKQLRKI